MQPTKDIKLCFPSSSGGHLLQLYKLKDFWESHQRFWVTFNKEDAKSLLGNEIVFYCYFPTNRNIWNLLRNTLLAIRIIKKERPTHIISTGAAVAIPFFYIGKLFGCKTIYIEVFDRIDSGTLTGKIVERVCDKFIVQWDDMTKVYKNSINFGSVF